jgi:PAS domain-containing protein
MAKDTKTSSKLRRLFSSRETVTEDVMQVQDTPAAGSYLSQIEELGERLDGRDHEARIANMLMRSLIDQAPIGIIVCDANGKFRVWNDVARGLIKKGPEDIKPEDWPATYQLFDPHDHECLVKEVPLAKALRTGELVVEQLWVGNGSQRLIECTAKPVYCADQVLIGAVVYFKGVD